MARSLKCGEVEAGIGASEPNVRRADCVEDMTMRIALWICGCLAFAALPLDGGDRLAMTVQPARSFAPSFLRVRVRIEPSAGNRWLEVIADSDGFYRSSEIPLDGDRAPVTI